MHCSPQNNSPQDEAPALKPDVVDDDDAPGPKHTGIEPCRPNSLYIVGFYPAPSLNTYEKWCASLNIDASTRLVSHGKPLVRPTHYKAVTTSAVKCIAPQSRVASHGSVMAVHCPKQIQSMSNKAEYAFVSKSLSWPRKDPPECVQLPTGVVVETQLPDSPPTAAVCPSDPEQCPLPAGRELAKSDAANVVIEPGAL